MYGRNSIVRCASHAYGIATTGFDSAPAAKTVLPRAEAFPELFHHLVSLQSADFLTSAEKGSLFWILNDVINPTFFGTRPLPVSMLR
jgi:hypothetical protein